MRFAFFLWSPCRGPRYDTVNPRYKVPACTGRHPATKRSNYELVILGCGEVVCNHSLPRDSQSAACAFGNSSRVRCMNASMGKSSAATNASTEARDSSERQKGSVEKRSERIRLVRGRDSDGGACCR
eukprot:Polyplicarium_translucidae@DN3111_c0_g1_i5.p1